MLEGLNKSIYSVAYSPDDSILVTGSEDAIARIWDSKTANCSTSSRARRCDRGGHLARRRTIATGSGDKTVHIWNAWDGNLAVLKGHEDEINSLMFDTTGDRLVTTSFDTARIWNLADGRETAMLVSHDDFPRTLFSARTANKPPPSLKT